MTWIAKNTMLLAIIGFLGLIGYVSTAFIWNFGRNEISNDIQDWGSFGDYFGGLLNPIIGIASLVILGYISLLISRYGAKENESLFIKELKITTYDQLINEYLIMLNQLEIINSSVNGILSELNIELNKNNGTDKKEILRNLIKENGKIHLIDNACVKLNSFSSYLIHFPIRYRHIFKFNFDSKEFTSLKNDMKKMSDIFEDFPSHLREANMDGIKDFKKVKEFGPKINMGIQHLILNLQTEL